MLESKLHSTCVLDKNFLIYDIVLGFIQSPYKTSLNSQLGSGAQVKHVTYQRTDEISFAVSVETRGLFKSHFANACVPL